MRFAHSKALWLVTLNEAVTLEKSSVTAKCHSAKLLPIKPFFSLMTLVTLYCTDKVYRGEKNNEKCICEIYIYVYRTRVKRKCHLSCVTILAETASTATTAPTTPYNL